MNQHERDLLLTRRQLFGRTAQGIGIGALASFIAPELLSAAPGPPDWTRRAI